MKRYLNLGLVVVCAVVSGGNAVAAEQRKTGQVYAQEKRVIDLYNQVVAVDAQVEDAVDQIVAMLKQSRDSVDSKSRVLVNKEKAIDALTESITQYEQKRSMRLAELEGGKGYLSTDNLMEDVTQLDEKIDRRVDQVLELVASFTQSEGYTQYEETYKKAGGQKYLKTQRLNPEFVHNKKVVQRADHKTRQVIQEIKDSITKLEQKNAELNDRLRRMMPVEQKKALQDEMQRNNEMIAKRRQQLADLEDKAKSQPAEQVLDRKEARNLEQEIAGLMEKINAWQQQITLLDNEYDAQRIRLNTLYKQYGITEP